MKLAKCPECNGQGYISRVENLSEPIIEERPFYREARSIVHSPESCENCNGIGLVILEETEEPLKEPLEKVYCKDCMLYIPPSSCLIGKIDPVGNHITSNCYVLNKNYNCSEYKKKVYRAPDLNQKQIQALEKFMDIENKEKQNVESNKENREEIYPDW